MTEDLVLTTSTVVQLQGVSTRPLHALPAQPWSQHSILSWPERNDTTRAVRGKNMQEPVVASREDLGGLMICNLRQPSSGSG